ncbi:dihydrolipoamide acetyltransferase family protein [Mesobacillus maritimus]|uniref:dihydrolipoamide acetyltransferase family protein n=1 Tax=Mesobacillus maritimus TaxID=1643336 RepID=UPI00384D0376
MSSTVKVPKLGVEMTSATVDEWMKQEGDMVSKGDILLTIQTEKITYEIEAPEHGFLHIVGEVGNEYPIGETLAQLAGTKEEYQQLTSNHKPVQEKIGLVEQTKSGGIGKNLVAAKEEVPRKRKKISPLALKIARDHQLDLQAITGSGPAGVIKKRDVLAKIAEIKNASANETAREESVVAVKQKEEKVLSQGNKAIKGTRPLKGMRKIIAERMFASLHHTAQMTDLHEAEVSALVHFREELNQLKELTGFKISYTALLIKAVALVLKEIPILNASIEENEIVLWEDINIGMAVSIEDGLVVPVIHQADRLSLGQIQQQMTQLISKARNNQLEVKDMTGSTFTITNIGSYGSLLGTPILNSPEVAIVGTGAIQEKPVVKNGEIVVGKVMGISLTVDHRLIDGETAGKFQQRLKHILENPKLLSIN